MSKHLLLGLGMALLLGTACGKKEELFGGSSGSSALTRVSDITTADDRTALVGRKITLNRVEATDVVGDVVFWVGEPNNTVPVVLGSELRDRGEEGDINIRRGNHYRISGVVRLVENVDRNDATWRLVDDREMDAISAARVYIETSSVELER